MAQKSKQAVFTGVEPWVDLTWDDLYANFTLLSSPPVTTDGTIPGIRLTNPSNPALPPDNTGVRVEPSALFSGRVYITNLELA